MINFKDFQKNLHEDVEQIDEVVQGSKAHQVAKAYHKTNSGAKVTYNKDGSATVVHNQSAPGESLDAGERTALLHKSAGHKAMDWKRDSAGKGQRPSYNDHKSSGNGTNMHTTVNQFGTHKTHITNESVDEALVGNQGKLDVDKDGKIEKSDLKKLRKGKEEIVVNKGENVKEGFMKKSFREFVEELEEAKKDDYWDFKDLKDEPKSTTRKIAGKAYGGAAQKDDDDEDDKPAAKPTEKRGRGRPAGSKSGARTAGNGKQYGGLAIHSLNLPSKK